MANKRAHSRKGKAKRAEKQLSGCQGLGEWRVVHKEGTQGNFQGHGNILYGTVWWIHDTIYLAKHKELYKTKSEL